MIPRGDGCDATFERMRSRYEVVLPDDLMPKPLVAAGGSPE